MLSGEMHVAGSLRLEARENRRECESVGGGYVTYLSVPCYVAAGQAKNAALHGAGPGARLTDSGMMALHGVAWCAIL